MVTYFSHLFLFYFIFISANKNETDSTSYPVPPVVGHGISKTDSAIRLKNYGSPTLPPPSDVPTMEKISLTVEHYPQAESPTMTFNKLWTQMRKAGWKYCTGSGLVSFYYMHPSVAKMKKGEMMRRCTEGVHYFTSIQGVHRYAHEHLGWKGAGGNIELSPVPSTMSLTSRVKKRTGTNALESDAASPRKKSRTSLDVSVNSRQQTSPTKKRLSPRKRRNESITAASKSDSSVSSRSSSEKEYKAPPDMQPTIKDKLECCQLVLHPSFKKDKLSKSSSLSVVSSISYMEDDIKDFMKKSIQTGTSMDGMTLPSPGFLYICGGPGTGKVNSLFLLCLSLSL